MDQTGAPAADEDSWKTTLKLGVSCPEPNLQSLIVMYVYNYLNTIIRTQLMLLTSINHQSFGLMDIVQKTYI